nr:penicillin-binding transpeptidase domain-containing protein [Angustibacter aerolatus]
MYPPGSTFKIVTSAAALSSGDYDEHSKVFGGASLDLPQTSADLPNDFAGACGANDEVDLTRALEISCNTAYGWLGLKPGRRRAARAGPEVRVRRPAAHPHVGDAEQRARGHEPAAERPGRHRPVRRAGHAAADGDGQRGDRRRRARHVAVRREDRAQPRPRRHRPGPAAAG